MLFIMLYEGLSQNIGWNISCVYEYEGHYDAFVFLYLFFQFLPAYNRAPFSYESCRGVKTVYPTEPITVSYHTD